VSHEVNEIKNKARLAATPVVRRFTPSFRAA
jgi:hypothetical protein